MDILEITFDEIKRSNLKNIIEMINKFNAESIEVSSNNEDIESILNEDSGEDGVIYFRLKNINIFGTLLSEIFINLLIYQQELELNMSFNLDEIIKIDLSVIKYTVHKWNEIIFAKNYYCGYEPAIEKYTQFFSNTHTGPLKWS